MYLQYMTTNRQNHTTFRWPLSSWNDTKTHRGYTLIYENNNIIFMNLQNMTTNQQIHTTLRLHLSKESQRHTLIYNI